MSVKSAESRSQSDAAPQSPLAIVDRVVGQNGIAVACTHGLFTAKALARLSSQPDIAEIVTTDTVPVPPEKRLPNMKVLSIAPLLAEAIRRIHVGESVSVLFDA